MKYLAMLLMALVCVSCNAEEPETIQGEAVPSEVEAKADTPDAEPVQAEDDLDRQMMQAVEDAKIAAIEVAVEVAQLDSEQYAISENGHEEGIEYYRQGKLILLKSNRLSVYSLQKNGQQFGSVVVNKDWSPQIYIESNLTFSVVLTPIEEGGWELATTGGDPEFLEVYIVTSESVAPVSAERYMEHLALARGSAAAFQSIGDSLLEGAEDHAEE